MMLFIELEYLLVTTCIFFHNMDLEFLLSDRKLSAISLRGSGDLVIHKVMH